MRLFPPLLASAFLLLPAFAAAQPAGTPAPAVTTSPAPQNSPGACVPDDDTITRGTRLTRITATAAGMAIPHIGPLFDVHNVVGPISVTVAGCSTGGVPDTAPAQTVSWLPAESPSVQVGSGVDQFTISTIASNVPLELIRSAAVTIDADQTLHVTQSLPVSIGGVRLSLKPFDLTALPSGYRVAAPDFTFGPDGTGLHGRLEAIVPTVANAANPFQVSLDVGPAHIDDVKFFSTGGEPAFSGELSLLAAIPGLTVTSNSSKIDAKVAPNGLLDLKCACNLAFTYSDNLFHGHGIINSGVPSSDGSLSLSGDLDYAVDGTGGSMAFSLTGSANAITLSSPPGIGTGPLRFQTLTLQSQPSTVAELSNLQIAAPGGGTLKIKQLDVTAAQGRKPAISVQGVDVSSLGGTIAKGLQVGPPAANASDAECTDGSTGGYVCIHFPLSIDLGVGTVTDEQAQAGVPKNSLLAFKDSRLILGGKSPNLELGELNEAHVHFPDGLAFNLTSCSDNTGAKRIYTGPSELCLAGTVTLPDVFSQVLETRTIDISDFELYSAGNFKVCLVRCDIRDKDYAFDADDTAAQSAPKSSLTFLLAPSYALDIRALRFARGVDDNGRELCTPNPQGTPESAPTSSPLPVELCGAGTLQITQHADPAQTVARMNLYYGPNANGLQEFDLNGSVLRPVRYNDMSLFVTGFTGRFWPGHFQLHASGIASLVNEPLTAVIDDVGVDATRDPKKHSPFGGWKLSVTHKLDRGQTLAATAVRSVPKVFQLLENIATLYFAKWIIK